MTSSATRNARTAVSTATTALERSADAAGAGDCRLAPAVILSSQSPGAISDLDRRRFVKGAFETIEQHSEANFHAFAADPAIDTELTHRGTGADLKRLMNARRDIGAR